MVLSVATHSPSSAARTIQFHHYQPASPCRPFYHPLYCQNPPNSTPSPSMQHVSCLMAPRCALAKIYFYRLPFQFNPIHFAWLSISPRILFFKILIFGHKCGGGRGDNNCGNIWLPFLQPRHFHQDKVKMPRRLWLLALWPIGLSLRYR